MNPFAVVGTYNCTFQDSKAVEKRIWGVRIYGSLIAAQAGAARMEAEFRKTEEGQAKHGFPSQSEWTGALLFDSNGHGPDEGLPMDEVEQFRDMVSVVPAHMLEEALKLRAG